MINEQELMQSIDNFLSENKEAMLADLKTLIGQPSVRGEAAPGAPYGTDVNAALEKALAIARRMGLETENCAGNIGWADLPGKSKKQIATITHLDVVPAGNGWTSDPFEMIVKDGCVIGRGTLDDKGPAVLTLYIAKFFKERGEQLPYTLRLLFGTDEETGMEDVEWYLEHHDAPAFLFTPDGEFPVGYGEKGGYGGDVISAPVSGNLMEFEGGVAGNVVPDKASALVKADISVLSSTERVTVEPAGNGLVRITGHGVGGHASMPQGTVNAIALVVEYLLQNRLCSESENRALEMLHTLLSTTDGSSIGVASCDDVFGPLTCIGGTIALKEGCLVQNIDIRYPTSITDEEMFAKISAFAAQYGGSFKPMKPMKPFYIEPSSPAIRALVDTYNEVTGQDKKPFTMGGGTYARHFPNAVSFGIEEPEETWPACCGAMHSANEGVPIEHLMKCLKIYLLATARLMELEF